MVLDNLQKLLESLPKFDKIDIKTMSFEELCDLINTLEETSGKLEDIAAQDENRAVPSLDADMKEEAEFDEALNKEISKYNEDGTEKTKQQIADERWEKRQAKLTRDVAKISAFNDKVESFVNQCIEYISVYTSIIASLTNVMMYVDELQKQIYKGIEAVKKDPLVRELIYWIEIIKLKVKKFLIQIKRTLSNVEKKMWDMIANGKVCEAIAAAQVWLAAIAVSVRVVMNSIEVVLNLITDMLSVPGEGMSFFITPKSLAAVNISIINPHRSIANTLSDLILQEVQTLVTQSKAANIGLKASQISANVAKSMATGAVIRNYKLGMQIEVPSMEQLIRKAVDIIIALFPAPDPLPKFERLNIVTNPGFLIFLMGGWCRAGQVAFGLPGYMMGIKAQKMEYSE